MKRELGNKMGTKRPTPPPEKGGALKRQTSPPPPPPNRGCELGKLKAENTELRTALHDAICRPMGVVPVSAEKYYSADEVAAAEHRRSRLTRGER